MKFANFRESNPIDFLIRPITFQAQLVRDLSPRALRKRKTPRIRVSTVLDNFALELSQSQLECFAHVAESMSVYGNQLAAAGVPRPEQDALRSPKRWWIYLGSCVRCNLKRRLKWDEFHQWSRDVNIYARFHLRNLNSRVNGKSS